MLTLDQNTLFALEIVALIVLVALGIWRIFRQRAVATDEAGKLNYDMRRDGPRSTGFDSAVASH